MRELRIALVMATSSGGVGNHVRSLAAGLVERGARVTVVGPPEIRDRFDFTATGARFLGTGFGELPRPTTDLATAMRLRRLLAGADVVHAHGLRAGALSGLALFPLPPRRGGRSRLVVTLHNAPPDVSGALRTVYPLLERVVARRADAVLGVSGDLVARMRTRGAAEVHHAVVAAPAMPPPLRSRDEVRAEVGAADRPMLLTVARLTAQKDLHTLLDAGRYWRDRDPRPLVVIAGEGPCRAALAARIEAEALPVRLLGHRGDIPDLLAAADAFVLSSRWEGPSLVIMEALRAGLPVVATRVGGIADLYAGVALLVPPGDSAALAENVARVLDEPGLAEEMQKAAGSAAAALPEEADAVRQLAGLYGDLTRR